MRIIIFALLLYSVAAAQSGTSKPIAVPFIINSNDHIILPVTVGNVRAHVIFDTGSGIDVMAPSLIAKAQGKPSGELTVFTMRGDALNIPLFVVPNLSIGPLKKENAVVGSWDVLDKTHIDGIVSINDFREQPVTLDFIKDAAIFETRGSLVQRRKAGIVVPLKFDDLRGVALDMFSQFRIGNQPGLCEIDTGSQNATINTRYMASLDVTENGKGVQKRQWTALTGASTVRYDTFLPRVSLATAPQINLVNPAVSFSKLIYDCVVGIDFWRGKILTIDIQNREMIVSNQAVH